MESKFYEMVKCTVQFGKKRRGVFGTYYDLPILIDVNDTHDHIEIENNILKSLNEEGSGWKHTYSTGCMEKYEHVFTSEELEEHGLDSSYKTIIISTCGKEWENLMGSKSFTGKYPRYVTVIVYHN